MAKSLTPQAVGALLSLVLILLVGGGMAYMSLRMAQPVKVEPKVSVYDTAVLNDDMKIVPQAKEKNIFYRTVTLRRDTRITKEQISYSPADIGKTELNEIGR